MRIAVFGAGSIGCWIGGALMAAGLDVLLIGRKPLRDEIGAHGLGVSDGDGWHVHFDPDRADFRTQPKAVAEADVIALTVKSTGAEAAAAQIARHARPGATVIAFQNGVSSAPLLKRLLPKLEVVPGSVRFNVARLPRGRWHKGTAGDIAVERTPVTEALAAAIGRRPGALTLADDMTGLLWGKLLINLNNAVNALSGLGLLDEIRQRDYRRVVAAAMLETLELLGAANIEPAKASAIPPRLLPHLIRAPDAIFSLFLRVQKIDAKARSSMADDLAAGRPTEIDYLNGEVVKLAASLGRQAPVNAAMVAMVREAERGGRRNWKAVDLRKEVLHA